MPSKTKPSILVADDMINLTEHGRTRSDRVLLLSSFLAKRLDAQLAVCYVKDWGTRPIAHIQNEARIALENSFKHLNLEAKAIALQGRPAEEILKLSNKIKRLQFVALGTQGHKGLRRLILGSVTEEVIRHSKVPVLTLGPNALHSQWDFPKETPMKLLVATDLGVNSQKTEKFAVHFAQAVNASITFIHCINLQIDDFLKDDVLETQRKMATNKLARKVKALGRLGIEASFILGDPKVATLDRILEESKKGYHFVLLGTHGQNLWLGSFFGSVSRGIILESSIPVITVHSKNLR